MTDGPPASNGLRFALSGLWLEQLPALGAHRAPDDVSLPPELLAELDVVIGRRTVICARHPAPLVVQLADLLRFATDVARDGHAEWHVAGTDAVLLAETVPRDPGVVALSALAAGDPMHRSQLPVDSLLRATGAALEQAAQSLAALDAGRTPLVAALAGALEQLLALTPSSRTAQPIPAQPIPAQPVPAVEDFVRQTLGVLWHDGCESTLVCSSQAIVPQSVPIPTPAPLAPRRAAGPRGPDARLALQFAGAWPLGSASVTVGRRGDLVVWGADGATLVTPGSKPRELALGGPPVAVASPFRGGLVTVAGGVATRTTGGRTARAEWQCDWLAPGAADHATIAFGRRSALVASLTEGTLAEFSLVDGQRLGSESSVVRGLVALGGSFLVHDGRGWRRWRGAGLAPGQPYEAETTVRVLRGGALLVGSSKAGTARATWVRGDDSPGVDLGLAAAFAVLRRGAAVYVVARGRAAVQSWKLGSRGELRPGPLLALPPLARLLEHSDGAELIATWDDATYRLEPGRWSWMELRAPIHPGDAFAAGLLWRVDGESLVVLDPVSGRDAGRVDTDLRRVSKVWAVSDDRWFWVSGVNARGGAQVVAIRASSRWTTLGGT